MSFLCLFAALIPVDVHEPDVGFGGDVRVVKRGVVAREVGIREDLEERGVNLSNCLAGAQLIRRHDIALLMDDYDQVWHW